jgi:hypothetical protein
MTAATMLGLTAAMAQVPIYLPTNGLVAYYPFSGNANDISPIVNNGTVNGASLTTDRFGSENSAYYFNGTNNYITAPNNVNFPTQNFTFSIWFKAVYNGNLNYNNGLGRYLYEKGEYPCPVRAVLNAFPNSPASNLATTVITINNTGGSSNDFNDPNDLWHHYVISYNGTTQIDYLDGNVISSSPITGGLITNLGELTIGCRINPSYQDFFLGKIDDFGIWNRALTQQEITDLYNAVNCANNTAITPQTNTLATNSTAIFIATTSDPNPSYVWQSNFGQGFQTLNDFGNYNGTNTGTLNIANVQLSEHNQPIRVISTSGECTDTSNVAIINITDTCIITINDTITTLISVTDTLIINTLITGLTPPNNLNTIKLFPNPANNHITIDYGNFASMNGYTLKITNSIGQIVFTTSINQQSNYLDLTTWGGDGIYFVQIIDTQNNTIENRKIVLQ